MRVSVLRQKLVELGVAEDTLIVFVVDNGSDSPATTVDTLLEECYSDFLIRGMKGSKWEGGIRVPMIVGWGAVNPDKKRGQPMNFRIEKKDHGQGSRKGVL